MRLGLYIYTVGILIAFIACNSDTPISEPKNNVPSSKSTFFQRMDANATGVHFVNQVVDRNDFNVLTYRNYYNGGGVALGDINNDGLADIYFTANLGKNKIYLNKGNFEFEDITQSSGVGGTRSWSTGVTMADVNADGFLDIYVCNSGDIKGANKSNELFINNGDLSFTESAAEYGLANNGYSTQAAFFDYDQDGDLDCYLLNTSFKDPAKIDLFNSMRDKPDDLFGDKLYRNDNGKFSDVTLSAGIYSSQIGFGLGTCIGDINNDHLPDIYVSNDFWERDYLYINLGNGKFSEELHKRVNFCSISSMGGDIADINNDGFPEIISTDMLAADNVRLKANTRFDPYHLEDFKYRANYHYQIGQNCLHLNDGKGRFQELAMMSGVAATDWSWGALFFDFENDGFKDLFVSNGLQKDLMSMDFRDFLGANNIHTKKAKGEVINYRKVIAEMPSSPLKNYAFSNKGSLQFENVADELGLGQPSFSNGSAYGDLDNDGDMDLVVNNVNMQAFVYQNKADSLGNNYLKIKFEGAENNPFGVGATVRIETDNGIQFLENLNTRGFQSSTVPELNFGLGQLKKVNNLVVTWSDLKVQEIEGIDVNQTIVLKQDDAKEGLETIPSNVQNSFVDLSTVIKGDSKHRENEYNDFDHEILLPHKLSEDGPRLIVGDVNGDKLDDFIALGAAKDIDKLFLQNDKGEFVRKGVASFEKYRQLESSSGCLFDYDKDGDLDLVLGAGGNEYGQGRDNFVLRYFENDGTGNFTIANANLPPIISNSSCIRANDFDNDGDVDLFIGSKVVPGNYGIMPQSYLLLNEGREWRDITTDDLQGAGMITDANWADVDNDGDADLVVVGEWMDIQLFINDGGTLSNRKSIPASNGWWNRIVPADLDGDGDLDFVLGNRGTNSKLIGSKEKPLSMFVNDFDQNGKTEFIISWVAPNETTAFPFATKSEITQQIPMLKKQILEYKDYAAQRYETLFPDNVKAQSISYTIDYSESAILWNEPHGFVLTALPWEAQVSPAYGVIADDLDDDGKMDIWLGGNLYGLKPQIGRHDASRGVFLKGEGNKRFKYVTPEETGIYIEGEVRDIVKANTKDGSVFLVARNNENILAFKKRDN